MIIKKYIVDDMKEAIVRAKYELGKEAIIVSQRDIKIGKWYNPFKKLKIEVTVALEENVHTKTLENIVEALQEKSPVSTPEMQKEKVPLETVPLEKTPKNRIPLNAKNSDLSLEEFKNALVDKFYYNPLERKVELDRINVFIGPTGVGKTTTIAKVAAREYLVNKRNVGLMTIDTYRIGAVEQLKTYAKIIGLPFEVVNEPNEMEEKLDNLNHCDIILIDTLGTSPRDQSKLDEIHTYLQKINSRLNTYLTLSMSTDKDTLLTILDKYNYLHYDALVLTKFDESNHVSNLWTILENCSFPIQFICNGQKVPDDIQEANLENVFAFCKGE